MTRYIYRTTVHGFDCGECAVVEPPDGFEKVSEHYQPMVYKPREQGPAYYSAATLTILWRREES